MAGGVGGCRLDGLCTICATSSAERAEGPVGDEAPRHVLPTPAGSPAITRRLSLMRASKEGNKENLSQPHSANRIAIHDVGAPPAHDPTNSFKRRGEYYVHMYVEKENPYPRVPLQGHPFKNCPHWERRQKILWAEVRRGTWRGKDRFKFRDVFADER